MYDLVIGITACKLLADVKILDFVLGILAGVILADRVPSVAPAVHRGLKNGMEMIENLAKSFKDDTQTTG